MFLRRAYCVIWLRTGRISGAILDNGKNLHGDPAHSRIIGIHADGVQSDVRLYAFVHVVDRTPDRLVVRAPLHEDERQGT